MNPRFRAFLTTGRVGNAEYMAFIQEAKAFAAAHGFGVSKAPDKYYSNPWYTVTDHDAFTKGCWVYALTSRIAQEDAA